MSFFIGCLRHESDSLYYIRFFRPAQVRPRGAGAGPGPSPPRGRYSLVLAVLFVQQGGQHLVVDPLGLGLEPLGQAGGLVPVDAQQLDGHEVAPLVVQGHAGGETPVRPGQHLGADLGVAPQDAVDLGQVSVALVLDRVGQAALAGLAVLAALVGDGVEPLLQGHMPGLHQLGHRLGKIQIVCHYRQNHLM